MNNPNPYQAPEPQASFVAEDKPRVSTVPRPLSVWITLVLLIVVLAMLCWGLVSGFYLAFTSYGNNPFLAYLAISLLIRLAFLAVLAVAIWGIFKQSQIGRWTGTLVLVSIFAASIYANMHGPQNANLIEYKSEDERFGGMIGEGLVFCAYLALIYRYGFGSKAKTYFAPRHDDEGESNQL